MAAYDETTYGERWAPIYDDYFRIPKDTEQTVAFLAERVGSGRALELAIGTGRIALPLAHRGVSVAGIDSSPKMVARLQEKPGGAEIPVGLGNFADVRVDGTFTLIFVVWNTFFALPSAEDQRRCFQNVAAHLTDDGLFVIEAFVPDLTRFDRGQRVEVSNLGPDQVWFETSIHDSVRQRMLVQHVRISEQGIKLYPVELRYAWPHELDLMAELAGLALAERWGGWAGEPFTAASLRHVSVYQKAGGDR
jgi:SAM-dependent methyltransferase